MPKILGTLTIELARMGVFRGKLMEDQRHVDDSIILDIYEPQDILDMFYAFAEEHGYTELEKPKLYGYEGGAVSGGLVLDRQPNEWKIISLSLVPPPEEISPEEQEIQRIEQEEQLATTRIFKVWRKRLDTFKTAQSELPLKKEDRTTEEQERWLQLRGAIDSVSAFLTDLQRVRGVNQSTLNV